MGRKNRTKDTPVLPARGTLPDKVKSYIDKHKDTMSAEAMATHLRNPHRASSIQDYINKTYGENRKLKKELKMSEELETKPEWENFKLQFTNDELLHFKYKYVQLMAQFHNDIMATEEMQLYQVITLDILIQRIMKEQKAVNASMERKSVEIEQISMKLRGGGDIDPKLLNQTIRELEYDYAKCGEQLRDLSSRYESYLMRQSAMLKEMKGTRDQRVKIFENSRQSFLGYLRLLSEEDQRATQGHEAELMRLAMEAEAKRLATPHTYIDGTQDQPLLTPETIQDY